MDESKKLEILADVLAGKATPDVLIDIMAENCKYHSDYAERHFTSRDRIIERMRTVQKNVKEDTESDSSYKCGTVKLADVFNEGIKAYNLYVDSQYEPYEYGILMYQFDYSRPAAVVYIVFDAMDKISEIHLSRSREWFDVEFYREKEADCKKFDTPYTVLPMTPEDKRARVVRRIAGYPPAEDAKQNNEEVYVWRQADKAFQDWLEGRGYYVTESEVFENEIGYKCKFEDRIFTVYMYAVREDDDTYTNCRACAKLAERDFSEGTILVSYLSVRRETDGEEVDYIVGSHVDPEKTMELWSLCKLEGLDRLLYFPGESMLKMIDKLVCAFNSHSLDALDCILIRHNPCFSEFCKDGGMYNDAVYYSLTRIYEEYGKMKIGYMSYDTKKYCKVPYIEGYGWFSFSVNSDLKIDHIVSHKFDDEELEDFIYSEEEPSEDAFECPAIVSVETFPKEYSERFALKASFDNGEIKKYVLPISPEHEDKEVVTYNRHVFSDGIWASARIEKHPEPWCRGYDECLPGVSFKNGYVISEMMIYLDGTEYSEPALCNEVIFEDDEYRLEKIWTWDVDSIYEDEDTGMLKVSFWEKNHSRRRLSTVCTKEGKRITSLEFTYCSGDENGLLCIQLLNGKEGFMNRDGTFVIPPLYDSLEDFWDGYAPAIKDGANIAIKQDGTEIKIEGDYKDVGHFSDGMCRVSTMKLSFLDLAYHSDQSNFAGCWGYVDETGKEVIKPQYIYAYEFYNGIAIACKGEWTKNPKWDYKDHKDKYWTEEELWGGIDKDGNEVIPFVFDEIDFLDDDEGYFKAHYGGWKEGHWGVIDRKGAWIVEPIFGDIGYEYNDGLFTFYENRDWDDDQPCGVYDINQKRVLFEPQFFDVDILDDGFLCVEVFDEKIGRHIEKIIDLEGAEKFPSEYSTIYAFDSRDVWRVSIYSDDGKRMCGLIDRDGNEILPCIYEADSFTVCEKEKRVIVKNDKKDSLLDFDGNVITSQKYDDISSVKNEVCKIAIDDDKRLEGLMTLDGKEIISPKYERIEFCGDGYFACAREDGYTMLKLIKKTEN